MASAPVVIGVDPGTQHTGYGVIAEKEGRLVGLAWGSFLPDRPSRFLIAAHDIHRSTSVPGHTSPRCPRCREAFFAKNVHSAVTLAHARGVTLVVAAAMGLEVVEIVR